MTIIPLYILNKMKKIVITIQEIWQATRSSIRKSKKTYSRKNKHKSKEDYGRNK